METHAQGLTCAHPPKTEAKLTPTRTTEPRHTSMNDHLPHRERMVSTRDRVVDVRERVRQQYINPNSFTYGQTPATDNTLVRFS